MLTDGSKDHVLGLLDPEVEGVTFLLKSVATLEFASLQSKTFYKSSISSNASPRTSNLATTNS